MTEQMLRQYTVLVDYLGQTLGPDYEVVLHEILPETSRVAAIANGTISGRSVGAPITNAALRMIMQKQYETSDYNLNYTGQLANGKTIRSSTMFIKDGGKLVGLLCINFDSSRYQALSKQVMDLCGGALTPAEPSGTSLIVDENAPSESPREQGFPTSIAGATASIVSQVVADYPVEVDRLTQDEKMEIMDILNRKGVFLLKGSVSYVAKELHSSEASIYRYLGKLNNRS